MKLPSSDQRTDWKRLGIAIIPSMSKGPGEREQSDQERRDLSNYRVDRDRRHLCRHEQQITDRRCQEPDHQVEHHNESEVDWVDMNVLDQRHGGPG